MINFTSKPRYMLDDLIRLVHALRAPGGCPWDAAQTHLSIRRNFLEEAYEACEALDCDDEAMLREELGDVLLQVLFHADIEADRGRMTIDDIADDGLSGCGRGSQGHGGHLLLRDRGRDDPLCDGRHDLHRGHNGDRE